jgi:phosphatidylglycerophosphate synthase
MAGKLKMVFQCGAAVFILWLLSYSAESAPDGLATLTRVIVWLAVVSTVYSGVIYVVSAARLMTRTRSSAR